MTSLWDHKPYYSLDYYFKSIYGQKIYKVALHGGMTCPNRDGTLDTRGCIFCSQGGSGEFAAPINSQDPNIPEQLANARARISQKIANARYVAYFQPFSNTYAPVDYLRKIYTAALDQEDIVGLSIATRPDCIPDEVLDLFDELNQKYEDKFIWVELGLQSAHRKTAQYIRRGYETSVFETTVKKLHDHHIPIIVHVILGLPYETREDMLGTIEYLNTFPIFGIKLQLLHVLKGTDLATRYMDGEFDTLTKNEYISIVISCLEHLSSDIVIHRVTGDGPRDLLIAPTWSTDKRGVLNTLIKTMLDNNTYQGRLYNDSRSFDII